MPASKANQRAVNKYKKNNYDRIEITVPKGQREVFQAHAAAHNESVNGFITRAIQETIARDTAGTAPEAAGGPQEAGVVSLAPRYHQSRPECRSSRRRDRAGICGAGGEDTSAAGRSIPPNERRQNE